MSKPLDEPIMMLEGHIRAGSRFRWREAEHRISAIGGQWARRGRWWLGEGARRYFRITTLDNIALDICYDEAAQSWMVAEMMD